MNIVKNISMENQGLQYKLSIIFGLFFLTPIAGFMYFATKYDILNDEYIPIYFIALLAFAFSGLHMLRKMFDKIAGIYRNMSQVIASEFAPSQTHPLEDELNGIAHSFQTIKHELKSSASSLEKNTAKISILKELSDLCYTTFNTEDLFYITLERALKLADAHIGSVMILEKPKRDIFVIEASIGLNDIAKKGDRTSFANSVAKYAVINKAPLLVEDIETDIRIGRQSRPQYATKSFICMPIKTMNDVIGVLTISRSKTEKPFTQEDVDVLIPLLSNAAFTHDNLRLLKEGQDRSVQLKTMGNISAIINSSLRNSELLHAILNEMKAVIHYELAIIMILDGDTQKYLYVFDFLAFIPTGLNKGDVCPLEDTLLGRVLKQQRPLLLQDTNSLTHPVEMRIFNSEGVHNAFLAPLKTEGQATGVLILCNVLPATFNNTDKLIEAMAHDLSRAVEKEKLVIAFARRSQEQDTLSQIGSALAASTFDMDKVLQHTMDIIQVIMDVEAGSLMFLNDNELEFTVAFNVVTNVDCLKGSRFNLGEGIAGYSAARGEPMIVKDTKKSKQFNPYFDHMTGFETRSVLCVPLISQGRVRGVIEVLNKRRGEFTPADLQLLQSIATTVSIAMENARLYGETLTMAEKERGIRHIFQKYVPKEVIDKITFGTEESPLIGEFKIITLLNIDIRGYSTLSHKIGPQKTVIILNYFFATMGEIVFKHHGIVDKYLGDGFLALFGAPISSPLDADNAVAAALDMQNAMVGVSDYLKNSFGASLSMGVSIHTGEMVVGNIGFDKKMDYTVIGDAVNFVFRLQALCKPWPNGILISEKTYYACQSIPQIEETDAYESDSSTEKLKIYRVIGL